MSRTKSGSTTRTARTPSARVADAGDEMLTALKNHDIPANGTYHDDEATVEITLHNPINAPHRDRVVDVSAVAHVAARNHDVDVEIDGHTATFTA